MDRPRPAEWQPRLRWWGHAWRLAAMLVISGLVWAPLVGEQSTRVRVLDVVVGLAAYALVALRRQAPLPVALLAAVLSGVSATAGGPAVLAATSLATHRKARQVVAVGLANLAASYALFAWQPGSDQSWLAVVINNLVANAAVLGTGLYIGSRRELLWTLRQRAERAEAEQELRAAQARVTERSRIAREMHDVLAHRISQVAMHAGALAYRDDLGADELRAGVRAIQAQAHETLDDLRGVLGVLRDSSGEAVTAPQPTYDDVPALVEQARVAGLEVSLLDELEGGPGVPDPVGRAVYRIVQEGLTNVRKHAPGATLRIRVTGGPADGVRLHLDNPLGFGSGTPGAGLGLVGLTERAELLGGRLEHRRERGSFVVDTWIPWAA